MEPRNRGRAKGARPRGAGPYPPPGQTPGPSGHHQQHQPAAPQGAWGRPPAPVQAPPAPSAWIRPPSQPSSQLGRGSRQGAGDQQTMETDPPRALALATGGEGDGNGNGARGGGNGGVRGRSNRFEIIKTRPSAAAENKKGSSGRPVKLSANYFELIRSAKWCLYQYRVDFAPEEDNTAKKRMYMRTALLNVIQAYMFDGTCLYTPTRLTNDPMELVVAGEGEERIRISIRLVGDVVWGDSHYFQLYNLIIRKCLQYMDLHEIKRKHYDPKLTIDIREHNLLLWPGFTTSMRQHERKILLNVDCAFKVMRTDTVLDLLRDLSRRGGNVKKLFADAVIGSIVLTRYNNKTYRIDDVSFDENPNTRFQLKDGTTKSFREYFEKYRETIKDVTQPLLISRSRPREIRAGMPETVKLIPELCIMTGLTDQQRDNMELMRAMAQHTRIAPVGRVAKLMDFMTKMLQNPNVMQEVRRWDLSFANRLIEIDGRVLPPEEIHLGDKRKVGAGDNADWTNAFRNTSMFYAPALKSLVIIVPRRLRQDCESFVRTMQDVAKGLRWEIPHRPEIIEMDNDRVDAYVHYLEQAIQRQPMLVMCVVFRKATDIYTAIKKKSYVDRGIPTQVVTKRSIGPSRGAQSIATKILIQMNCKIGGAPWSVVMPLSNLMVCGYDVCRDTAQRGKSFGAVVASMDSAGTRYFSSVSEHKTEEELSNNFGSNILAACNKYKDINGRYPDRILIYRDGVGDGQLPYVYNHEVVHIKKLLTDNIYRSTPLRMAFVVVSKRINTKIFAGRDNPKPGTVVDDVITLPERYDFFIVSQCVRQGTVAPTSYNIIEDTMGLNPDKMQMLSYKLCHMYYNWSGTVRVPAPCQYAHRLSQLVSQCLHRAPHQNLKNLLYFL